MGYQKPGVEIKQVQGTATPILNAADLESVVVGPGYYIQPLTEALDSSGDPLVYSGVSVQIDLENTNATWNKVSTNDQQNYLPILDLVGVAGSVAGETYHLTDSDLTWGAEDQVTVAADITGWDAAGCKAEIKISWRQLRDDLDSYRVINSIGEIETKIGQPTTYNPLAYGVLTAMNNAGSAIGAFGAIDTDSSLPEAEDYTSAMGTLELSEIYACAIMTHHDVAAAMKAAAETASTPQNKKERIVIVNKQLPTGASGYYGATEDKDATSADIRDTYSAFGSKRLIMTHPDMVYVEELRHVTSLKQSWIEFSFESQGTYAAWDTIDAYARFSTTTQVGDKLYYYWDPITDAVHAELIAAGFNELLAFVPAPGFYYGAAVAGQSAGQLPQQPFTNLAVAGLSKTWGSQDHYNESQLNTMAGGGAYIMTQKSPSAPMVSRHQVSTNVSSIAKRELSITRAIDYSSKFVRSGLEPYIGKNNITPAFLKLFNSVLVAQGLFLVREGVLNDFKVTSVKVEDTAPDSILADIEILVKYPVNYIKIQLIF